MRLVDADELIEECHTIPDPKGKYFCLDIIEKYEIEEAQTACDINAIKNEIKQLPEVEYDGKWETYPCWKGMKEKVLQIIDKYTKGENKNDNKRTETCNF